MAGPELCKKERIQSEAEKLREEMFAVEQKAKLKAKDYLTAVEKIKKRAEFVRDMQIMNYLNNNLPANFFDKFVSTRTAWLW